MNLCEVNAHTDNNINNNPCIFTCSQPDKCHSPLSGLYNIIFVTRGHYTVLSLAYKISFVTNGHSIVLSLANHIVTRGHSKKSFVTNGHSIVLSLAYIISCLSHVVILLSSLWPIMFKTAKLISVIVKINS